MTYESERDEAAENFNNEVWGGEEDRCFIMSFKRGSDWSNARAEKRIQELEEHLRIYKDESYSLWKKIKTLEADLAMAMDALENCKEDRHYGGVFPRHQKLVESLREKYKGFKTQQNNQKQDN